MTDTDPFDAYLAKALGASASEAEIATIDSLLRLKLRSARESRQRRWLIVAIAAAALLVPASVAASLLVTRVTEAPLGLQSAADFRAEVAIAKNDITLPEGWRWPRYLEVAYPNGSYSRGGGRLSVESAAFCIWTEHWLSTRGLDDTVGSKNALGVLSSSRGWTFYAGPLATESARLAIGGVIDAALAGNEVPARDYAAANCAGGA